MYVGLKTTLIVHTYVAQKLRMYQYYIKFHLLAT